MKRTFVLLTALLCPMISMAGRGPEPMDQIARIAMDNAPPDLMSVLTQGESNGVKVLASHTFKHPDGDMVATYELEDDDWRLIAYRWDTTRSAKVRGRPVARMDDPVNPDPNPPTVEANLGEEVTHIFMIGPYEYTVDYSWGVKDGVVGWHVDHVQSVYKPGNSPNEDHSGSE